jgi:hypothetical protein
MSTKTESKPAASRTRARKTAAKPADTAATPVVEPTGATENVEQERKEQLAEGKVTGVERKAANVRKDWTAAEHRAGVAGAVPFEGRVDNMTRRSDRDVLEGHFCTIDLSDSDAKAGVEHLIGDGNAHPGSGDYGVYVGPGTLGDDGYPVTARVLLRDEHAGEVLVPYSSLYPAQAGGRR